MSSVNVRLVDGTWFEVPFSGHAEVRDSGTLQVWSLNGSILLRTFGPASWITWDEEE